MPKTVLVVCPEVMFMPVLCHALEELKGVEVIREFSFNDGLKAIESKKPDLVVLQTDCRDEGRAMPLIVKMNKLKIPSVCIVCHCLQPPLEDKSERVVLQWLGHDLIGQIEDATKNFLGL